MPKMNIIYKNVFKLISENKKLAENDVDLYLAFVKKFNGENLPIKRMLTRYNYAGIVRARRKVLTEHPHLKPLRITKIRLEEEKEVRKWSIFNFLKK